MSREKTLLKSTFIYFIGTFGSKILTFLLLPVYSAYLSRKSYGSYDLINTIITIAYPAVTLMLDNSLYVFLINSKDRNEQEDLISYSVKIMIINSIMAVALILCVHIVFYPIKYVVWVITWLVTSSAYNLMSGIVRGFKAQKLFSFTGIIVTIITLVGNIIGLVFLHQDYKSLMIVNSIAYSVAVIFMEMRLGVSQYFWNGIKRKISKELKSAVFKYTIPLLPNQLSWWILNVSDRLMIVYYLGTADNGLYAMACKIPAILNMIHGIFSMSFSDDILTSKNMKDTESYANRVYNIYIRVMIGVSIFLMAANKLIFTKIIGGNFADAYKYTYFLYVGFVFSCIGSLLGAFYGYFKKSLEVSISSILAAMVNIGLNFFFLEKYGILVAGLSTLAGSIVIWIVRLLGLRGLVDIRIFNSTKAMFLLMIPFYFFQDVDGIIGNLVLTVLGTVIAVAVNYNTIVEIGGGILRKVKENFIIFERNNSNE